MSLTSGFIHALILNQPELSKRERKGLGFFTRLKQLGFEDSPNMSKVCSTHPQLIKRSPQLVFIGLKALKFPPCLFLRSLGTRLPAVKIWKFPYPTIRYPSPSRSPHPLGPGILKKVLYWGASPRGPNPKFLLEAYCPIRYWISLFWEVRPGPSNPDRPCLRQDGPGKSIFLPCSKTAFRFLISCLRHFTQNHSRFKTTAKKPS